MSASSASDSSQPRPLLETAARLELPSGVTVFNLNTGDRTVKIAMMVGSSAGRAVVRITGGCGGLTEEFVQPMFQQVVPAFDGFNGTLLFGGTRMLATRDLKTIVPGITEVAPMIRARNFMDTVMVGIAPRQGESMIVPGVGHVLYIERDYVTIIHPDQYAFVLLQKNADEIEPWIAEAKRCIEFIEDMRDIVRFNSLHLVYNGGGNTEIEIQMVARLGWPMLLIEGSGGMADKYAADTAFRAQFPQVQSCPLDSASIRAKLIEAKVLESR